MRLPQIILFLFVVVAVPLAGQPTLQSRGGELGVVPGEHGPRVRDSNGRFNPLYIADDVELHSLVPMPGGWLAAGVHPVGERQELYFRMLDAGGLKRLPAPTDQRGRFRQQPVVLADGERLQGLLWLEGDERGALAVKASRWLGITWSSPVTVSEVGPGSQLAVEAAILDDGSWLAVWSAYDGEDDEILWSLGIDGSWTEPLPLSVNSVPDILPTVAASNDGAVVAWSQFDGEEYRVVTTRLVEGRWIDGWKERHGTLYPRFYWHEEGPTLLFYDVSAADGVWRVHELDRDGQVTRRGASMVADSRRPLVLRQGDTLRLEWPSTGAVETVVWEKKK